MQTDKQRVHRPDYTCMAECSADYTNEHFGRPHTNYMLGLLICVLVYQTIPSVQGGFDYAIVHKSVNFFSDEFASCAFSRLSEYPSGLVGLSLRGD